ncbi:MAG TPA: helix-turn-helix transcriptional regulator [Thermoanaerobaculia bacterium]|jgi:DNA-binding CsgD family transcriptional regulator
MTRSAAVLDLRLEGAEAISRLAEDLVRQAAAVPSSADDDVLVDLEIDGVRCLVVRSEPKAAAPAPVAPTAAAPLIRDRLSPRELEIARMVAEGHPNKAIAAVLDISTWTVNTYLRRMFAKTGATSRAAMVAKLMRS